MRLNLVPFIKELHNDDNCIFWPDLVKAHYAEVASKYLESQYINLVPKIDNPPNVPKVRPIENIWACLSLKGYDESWQALKNTELILRIRNKLKDFDQKELQTLMKGGSKKTP